jgi:hypothetical protein
LVADVAPGILLGRGDARPVSGRIETGGNPITLSLGLAPTETSTALPVVTARW